MYVCSVGIGIDIVVSITEAPAVTLVLVLPEAAQHPTSFYSNILHNHFQRHNLSQNSSNSESSNSMTHFQIYAFSNHNLLEIIHYKTIGCVLDVVQVSG